MDCVVINKITGESHKIEISYVKLMLIKLLLPVSYVLYGLIIATILKTFIPNSILLPIILVSAYLINIPMSLSKNGISFVDRIHNFLISPITNSMDIREIAKNKNVRNEQTILNLAVFATFNKASNIIDFLLNPTNLIVDVNELDEPITLSALLVKSGVYLLDCFSFLLSSLDRVLSSTTLMFHIKGNNYYDKAFTTNSTIELLQKLFLLSVLAIIFIIGVVENKFPTAIPTFYNFYMLIIPFGFTLLSITIVISSLLIQLIPGLKEWFKRK
jgi:hypothetical protein